MNKKLMLGLLKMRPLTDTMFHGESVQLSKKRKKEKKKKKELGPVVELHVYLVLAILFF
jgi:hypothetical protein